MVKQSNFICISCPIGCMLNVTHEDGEIIEVCGNSCNRGITYAADEIKDPRRMVSSIMLTKGRKHPVPVRTSQGIPKDKIYECLVEIKKSIAPHDTKEGDVLIHNVANTGLDIVATRDSY